MLGAACPLGLQDGPVQLLARSPGCQCLPGGAGVGTLASALLSAPAPHMPGAPGHRFSTSSLHSRCSLRLQCPAPLPATRRLASPLRRLPQGLYAQDCPWRLGQFVSVPWRGELDVWPWPWLSPGRRSCFIMAVDRHWDSRDDSRLQSCLFQKPVYASGASRLCLRRS